MAYNTALLLAILSIVSILILIKYYNTALFGFTTFAFFNIARASFSAFLFGHVFNLNQVLVTSAHLWVVTYTGIGLICFVIGAWLAWQPLHQAKASMLKAKSLPPWINPQLAIILMISGIFVYIASPVAQRIPTLQAVWSNYQILPKIGLLIALINGINTKRYTYTILCCGLFLLIAVPDIVLSGHIFSSAIFLIQALFVVVFWSRVTFKSLITLALGFLLFGSIFVGWLDSRYLIREGYLDNFSLLERVDRFSEVFELINPFQISPLKVYSSIKQRLDLSDILAEQTLFQPRIQPFAYGGTITTDLLAALIPRFMWPSKPVLAGGSVFVSRYTGLSWNNTSMGLPYHFELYANGGAVIVFLGLFMIGWLIARLEVYLLMANLKLPRLLGLFIILFAVTGWEARIVLICVSMISGVIGVYALGSFLLLLNNRGWFRIQQETLQFQYQEKSHFSQSKSIEIRKHQIVNKHMGVN